MALNFALKRVSLLFWGNPKMGVSLQSQKIKGLPLFDGLLDEFNGTPKGQLLVVFLWGVL